MKREVVKNNKEAFDFWVNGGDVLYRNCNHSYDRSGWRRTNCPNWTGENTTYLPADKYSCERRAGADGEQLQVSYDDGKTWWDKSYRKMPWNDGVCIRVKPQPQFKEGDWVRLLKSDEIMKVFRYVSDTELFLEIKSLYSTKSCHISSSCSNTINDIEPWIPKHGDWCWFWDNGSPILAQYDGMNYQGQFLTKRKGCTHNRYYDNCEPFLGELPTVLRTKECQ